MFGFIGNIGPWELALILLVALIVVGPGKLPEVAKGMGKALNEFKKVTSGVQKDLNDAINSEVPQAATPAPVFDLQTGEVIKTPAAAVPVEEKIETATEKQEPV